jgi:hypothetical protein
MNNVTFIDITDPISGDIISHAIIDRGNDEYTAMLKSTYEAQQAALSTPIVIDETETK